MVLALVSPSLLPPISVRQLCGRHSALLLSTLEEVSDFFWEVFCPHEGGEFKNETDDT